MKSGFRFDKTVDITPEQIAEMMPGTADLSGGEEQLNDLTVQRFHLPPSRISLPTVRDNLLVIHLQGPVYVEEEFGSKRSQGRWSERNQISITPAGEGVTRLLKGRPEVLIVHLADRLIKEVASEVWGVDPSGVSLHQCLAEPDEHVSKLGRALQAEVFAPAEGTALMAESLSHAMAIHLLRRHSSLGKPPMVRPMEMAKGRLNRVLHYMTEHLDEQLSLKVLADLSGVSPSHFARSFRHSMNQSPHQYLISLRVQKARELLEETLLTIIEIGLICGFSQPNHFSSIFRKNMGLSPRAWRLEFQK